MGSGPSAVARARLWSCSAALPVLDGAGCAQRVGGDGRVLADAVRPVGGLVLHTAGFHHRS